MEKILNMDVNRNYSPYIRVKDTVTKVMSDVILALLPAMAVSYAVYGIAPVLVILTSILRVSRILCKLKI